MIRGIGRNPYIDLDPYIDVEGFKNLHPEIARGFALARDHAKEGTWMRPNFDWNDSSYILNWKPIYKAYEEFQQLPNDHPVKIEGMKIHPTDFKDFRQRNIFVRYLKSTMGAHDPYIYYFLWEDTSNMSDRGETERSPTPEQQYFPSVVSWVNSLKKNGIIEHVGRVIFFLSESSNRPFEHRDIDHSIKGDEKGYSNHRTE
jgi:hypothetical protein